MRREYLYRKSLEVRKKTIQEKKEKLRRSLNDNALIPTELRKEAISLQDKLGWDDEGKTSNKHKLSVGADYLRPNQTCAVFVVSSGFACTSLEGGSNLITFM